MESPSPDIPKYIAANYCISFMDLLGQRDGLRGQGLLPIIRSEADDSAFQKILRDSVGPILRLQRDVDIEQSRKEMAVIQPAAASRAIVTADQYENSVDQYADRSVRTKWVFG